MENHQLIIITNKLFVLFTTILCSLPINAQKFEKRNSVSILMNDRTEEKLWITHINGSLAPENTLLPLNISSPINVEGTCMTGGSQVHFYSELFQPSPTVTPCLNGVFSITIASNPGWTELKAVQYLEEGSSVEFNSQAYTIKVLENTFVTCNVFENIEYHIKGDHQRLVVDSGEPYPIVTMGDGTIYVLNSSFGPTVNHHYALEGTYTVNIKHCAEKTKIISINQDPVDLVDSSLSSMFPTKLENYTNLRNLSIYAPSTQTNGYLQGEIPEGFFDSATSLRTISIEGNNITSFPLGVFDTLTKLNLVHFTYGSISSSIQNNLFMNNIELRNLVLSNNQISSIAQDAFENNKKLEFVRIHTNSINQSMASIASAFHDLPELMFLDLANNQMTGAFGENIFQNNPKLKNYYVNQNKLSGYEPVFSQVVSDIKSIYLQSNNFTSMDLDKYLEHFVEMIESCSPSGGGIKIESQSTGASPTNENLIQILNAKGCNVTYD